VFLPAVAACILLWDLLEIYFYIGGLRADKIGTVKFVMLLLEIGYGSTATLSDRDCRRFELALSWVQTGAVPSSDWLCSMLKFGLPEVQICGFQDSNWRCLRLKLVLSQVQFGNVPG
jgi:hypothetical protein